MWLKKLLLVLVIICFGLFNVITIALAAEKPTGAQLFQVHCAGCHLNGGNIVRRGKTLKLKALQHNGMDSLKAIAQIVTNGKNNMSAYRDRLTPDQIQEVSIYVLEQANEGWH